MTATDARFALPGSSVTAFVGLTFAWAWLFWGYWVVAMPPGGLQISTTFILCAIIGGFAPSLSGLALARAGSGMQGMRDLVAPVRRWRFAPSQWAIAIALVPATALLSALMQPAFIGPLKWPDPSVLAMALIWPLMAAAGEEFGWRGYLLPRLEQSFGLLRAAFVIGLVWGVWHLPADYVALKGYGDWFLAAFLVNGPIVLTAHSIVMAWLWRRTGGSLLAVIVYHVSITASAMIAPSAGSDGLPGVLSAATGAALVWAAAGALLVFRGNDFN
ncbi:MAG TPA: CPBP family intramembrane glutamic endopeptidase [Devosia sp.]|nr:CPBP family intramembrane glutamic endopeptidase [Devosia sp.]